MTISLEAELLSIARRLIELGLHDEARAVIIKAQAIADGHPIPSSQTLAMMIEESSVLKELHRKLHTTFTSGIYLDRMTVSDSIHAADILSDAMVEILRFYGGVADKITIYPLVARAMNVSNAQILYVDNFARAEGKLSVRPDRAGTLQVSDNYKTA